MEDHDFAPGAGERGDRAAADFAAGAGGRRDGDQRRQAVPVGLVIKLRQVETGPPHQQTRGLADIERAAAADGDHTVAIVCAKRFRRIKDILLNRVGMNSIVKKPGSAFFLFTERLLKQLERTCAEQARIGYDQRLLNP